MRLDMTWDGTKTGVSDDGSAEARPCCGFVLEIIETAMESRVIGLDTDIA